MTSIGRHVHFSRWRTGLGFLDLLGFSCDFWNFLGILWIFEIFGIYLGVMGLLGFPLEIS